MTKKNLYLINIILSRAYNLFYEFIFYFLDVILNSVLAYNL